jgi:hypothetical protein
MFANGEIPTLNGETATILVGPPAMIENAVVVGDQVLAANGVIHPINEVLLLPTQTTTAAPVTAAPLVPATQPPITAAPVAATLVTAAPVNAEPVTLPPALLPVAQAPASAVPGDTMVVVIGSQEAPALAPLPMLQVVDIESKSKDEKKDGSDGDGNGAVLSAFESALLGECQGDCDYNDDCAAGLVCVNSKGLTSIHGCQGTLDGKRVPLLCYMCLCKDFVQECVRFLLYLLLIYPYLFLCDKATRVTAPNWVQLSATVQQGLACLKSLREERCNFGRSFRVA